MEPNNSNFEISSITSVFFTETGDDEKSLASVDILDIPNILDFQLEEGKDKSLGIKLLSGLNSFVTISGKDCELNLDTCLGCSEPSDFSLEFESTDYQEQVRKHRKKRINKKWAKKYGFRDVMKKFHTKIDSFEMNPHSGEMSISFKSLHK